jgi:hypothetical protein
MAFKYVHPAFGTPSVPNLRFYWFIPIGFDLNVTSLKESLRQLQTR